MQKTNILEVIRSILAFKNHNSRCPLREELLLSINYSFASEDVQDAINAGCVTEQSDKTLDITKAGEDSITGKVYTAREIFCKDRGLEQQ